MNQSKCFCFLFFNLFLLENKISLDKRNGTSLNSSQISSLNRKLECSLDELLKAGYEEPNQKQVPKFSSRYERIIYNQKEYILNYRTSEVGQLAFSIKVLIDSLEECSKDKYETVITFED
ncbi:hypothetical protein ACR79B_19915 [Sphingobacterium spiritivorum]